MPEEKNEGSHKSISIGGNIEGSANFVDGDQHNGTNIEGDVAGDVVENQNKTEIAGDMHGDLSQSMIVASGPVREFFKAIQEELTKSLDAPLDAPGSAENAFPVFPDSIVNEASSHAMDLPEPPEEYVESASGLSGMQLMSQLEVEAALPDDEQDPGWISAIVSRSKQFSPIIARAAMSGGEAWLRSTIKTSGVVSAAIAAISTIQEGISQSPNPSQRSDQGDSW